MISHQKRLIKKDMDIQKKIILFHKAYHKKEIIIMFIVQYARKFIFHDTQQTNNNI